jgi:esterase/lipase superfamily enzyme
MLRTLFALALGLSLLAPAAASAVDLLLDVRVNEALAAGHPDAAVAELQAALPTATDEQSEQAVRERLAALFTTLGRHAEAAVEFEALAALRAAQLGPNAPEAAAAWQSAASAWRAAGDTAKAVAAWSSALRIDAANGIAPETNPALLEAKAALAAIASPRERQRLEIGLDSIGTQSASTRTPKAPDAAFGDEGYRLVKIYYATNRARTDDPRPSDIYRADRGPLDYGTALVSIPKLHTPGALEAPSIFSFDVVEDPDRHLILKSVDPSDRATVFAEMRQHVAESGSNEAFVFVHGFNVTFSDAARRTAQIAHDMDFDGLPILYSWPSQGNMLGYLADGAVVQLSGRLLEDFLEQVVAESGATRIHLVAHSMGNRALTEALELFALKHAGAPPAFDQVLFTAPDLDAGLFAKMVETIRPAVGRMTLYTSKNDWALRVSNQLNGGAPRAGEGADGVLMPASVDSIDMSVLGEDMLAHSYFADDTSALTDILSLFWRDTPPARRCGMTPSPTGTTSADWSLEPTLCDGTAMLAALRLLRAERIGNLSDAIAVVETEFPAATAEHRTAIEAALRRLFE